MASTVITINHTSPLLLEGRASKREVIPRVIKLLNGLNSGALRGTSLRVSSDAATPANGTITLTTCLTGTVIEVNGVEFTAITSGTPDVTDGEFVISGDNDADAASLAAAINASTHASISGLLAAAAATNVVTVTALGTAGAATIKNKGILANGTITAAAVDTSDTFTINGTVFTGIVQRATGTLTAATAIAGTTFSILGTTFTGVAGAVVLGAQTFSIDTGNTETATSIAAQINGFAFFSGKVTATSATDVVTVRAVTAGTAANSYTFTGTVTVLAASGSGTLASGIAVANNQFDTSPGSTNTQVAADMARAINVSSTAMISGHVTATNRAAVVWVKAKYPGLVGNSITLASSDGTDLAVTGARLAGATEVSADGVGASAVVTIAGGSGDYTCTINGVNASGTVSFSVDNATTCGLIAAAINASTNALVSGIIRASASGDTYTVAAVEGGVSGNSITIAVTGTGATIGGSATRLLLGATATGAATSGDRLSADSATDVSITL